LVIGTSSLVFIEVAGKCGEITKPVFEILEKEIIE
jgi:hypothetical protein